MRGGGRERGREGGRKKNTLKCVCCGFPGGISGKGPTFQGRIQRRSGRSPGGGHGNPVQCPCLESPQGQGSLAGHRPQGRKESDVIEATQHTQTFELNRFLPSRPFRII